MLDRFIYKFSRFAEQASPREYMIVAACAVLIGFACMKGFGSRDKY
jgi:hypothetical protein